MKKTNLVLMLLSMVAASFTACTKEKETVITQTHTAQLTPNKAYVFSLPATDDKWLITTNPQHASINELGTDADGNMIYSYTPALDYYGEDQVILATTHNEPNHLHHGPKPGHDNNSGMAKGGCKGEEDDDYEVTINFIVSQQINAAQKTQAPSLY